MTSAAEQERQHAWRDWSRILEALPSLRGRTVLDLGCGDGGVAATLVGRGARVIGVDADAELVRQAEARGLASAEFRTADLRDPVELAEPVDGIWCSFTAAYFPDLPAMLGPWASRLRPGGWAALTEVDDLFGHEPLSESTRTTLETYAQEALAAGRYDFHMGRKLSDHVERAGLGVEEVFTVDDPELSFAGAARPEVIEAWRCRLDRMQLLRDHCGSDFERVRAGLLGCLARSDHRSRATVVCCVATRPAAAP